MPSPVVSSGLFVVAVATAGFGGPVLVAGLGDSIAKTLAALAASLPEPGCAPVETNRDMLSDVAVEPLASRPDAGGSGDKGRAPSSDTPGDQSTSPPIVSPA